MATELTSTLELGAATYVAKQVLGPTLTAMGQDLQKAWNIGKQRIFERAAAKTANLEDGKSANLRVARDVIWNGAVTDDQVCAEYFGGILAASRSEDGDNDSAIQYVDCIKGLSAKQLHLHYSIYRSLQHLLTVQGLNLNPAQQTELQAVPVCFPLNETTALGIDAPLDLTVLHRQNLVHSWEVNVHTNDIGTIGFCKATPSTFGVLLYAIAMNRLQDWRYFPFSIFEGNPDIQTPAHFAHSPDKLSSVLWTRNVGAEPSEDKGG